MKDNTFTYSAEGYTYRLALVWRLNTTKRVRIVGAEMYGFDNLRYYGFWSRENIPMNTVYQMEQVARALHAKGKYTIDANGFHREVMETKR